MSVQRFDRVADLTNTGGTGTLTLLNTPPASYQAFGTVIPSGTGIVPYTITDPPNNTWETGYGTFTFSSLTLARTQVLASSNGGAAVSFSSNSKTVILGFPAQDALCVINPGIAECRLSLSSTNPRIMTDQTAQTALYVVPDGGNRISLWNTAISDYQRCTFASSVPTINATDTSNGGSCTFTTGSKIVTGLISTQQLVRGMQVTGTGIAANSTIAAIPSGTTITLNNFPSSNGSGVALTFKLPPSTLYNVYGVLPSGGTQPAFQLGAGGLEATSYVQGDGVQFNTSTIGSFDSNSIAAGAGRLVGMISTTGVAGNLEDSKANRFVITYELSHRIAKKVESQDSTARSTSSSTYSQVGSVAINYITFADCNVELKGFTSVYTSSTSTYTVVTIGSSASVQATGATTSAGLSAINDNEAVCVVLNETPSSPGAITRYLIFKSADNVHAAHADGTIGGGPGTDLWANIQC